MTIPTQPIDTSQVDINTGQLPGSTEANSARVEIQSAIQFINDIIADNPGAEFLTTANSGGLALLDVANEFTQSQKIITDAGGLSMTLNDISAGQDQIANFNFTVNGSFTKGAAIDNDNSATLPLLTITRYQSNFSSPAASLELVDNGICTLRNKFNNGLIQIAEDGSITLRPLPGLDATINDGTTFNRILTIKDKTYGGQVNSSGNHVYNPNGWGVSRISQGLYRIVHGLNLVADEYVVGGNVIAAAGGTNANNAQVADLGTSSFDIAIRNGSGAMVDDAFLYELTIG